MSIISTTFISALNNYNSIAPLMAKDLVENVGRTTMAYCSSGKETKKYEATEKFIDANLSSLFWFGSIPFANKVFNKTVFKAAKLNPDVSLAFLRKGEKAQAIDTLIDKISKRDFPNNIIYKNKSVNTVETLKKVSDNSKLFKNLQCSRMITSLLFATYVSAIVLPKSIIKMTQFFVDRNYKKNKTIPQNNPIKNTPFYDSFTAYKNKKSRKDISFKSLGSAVFNKAINAQISPLDGMAAMDIAISSGRIYYVNKREKDALKNRKANVKCAAAAEKFIREAGAFYLIYFGGAHIKKLIDKVTKNKLDPVVLEDKDFAKDLKAGKLSTNPIKNFDEAKILDYVDNNMNNDGNPFIRYAKKLKWVETAKDNAGNVIRNPLKYLDTKKLKENFEVIVEAAPKFLKEKNLDEYVKKQAKIKRLGIYGNLISGSFAVCYILPKIMYGFRKLYTGSNEEPGIKQVLKNAKRE